jgi:DNA-binding CsgD family transcriptional regulator
VALGGLRPRGTIGLGGRYATGWSSLTEAELRVVRRVMFGLTDRQIVGRLYLSCHTVNSYVRHVL